MSAQPSTTCPNCGLQDNVCECPVCDTCGETGDPNCCPGPEQLTQPARLSEDNPVPLLSWPNSNTIWRSVMKHLEMEAHAQAGEFPSRDEPDDPLLTMAESQRLAPELARAVINTVTEYDLPQRLLEQLDQETTFCTDQVVEAIPENQLQALIAAVGKLQQGSQTQPA